MSDSNYQPKVYRAQGGNQLVIAPGGELLMEGAITGTVPGANTNYFVDSVAGSSSYDGLSWSRPKATVAQALALATAGDFVHVAPNHAETIDAAGDITFSADGVTVVCYGHGDDAPTFTFDGSDATPSILVSASDCRWSGGKFVNNEASLNHMFDVAGDDFLIEDAFFTEGSATGLFFIVADTADGDSDRLTIRRCRFYAPTAGNMDAAIQLGKDHAGVRIEGCDIYGDFDHGGIEVPAGGNACLDLAIHNCRVVNLLAGAEAIDINGTSCTGEIANCRLGTDAIATALNNGALRCYGNTWADTTDQVAAVPIPEQSGYFVPGLGYKVTKSHNLATDNVDLFTVTGRVLLTMLVGEVTTVVGGAATYLIRVKTANTNLFAASTIDSAAVDTLILPPGDAGDAASVVVKNSDLNGKGMCNRVVGSLGDTTTLESDMDAADTGVIRWDLYYLPLDADSRVVAA